jgi:OOP family OmpA-OmpF porin
MFKCSLVHLCAVLFPSSIRENNMFIKLTFGLVIGAAAVSALSQTITDIRTKTGNSAYAQDGRSVIVRNPYGLCWRSGYWTAADAVPGCDGQLAPPVAKITAPAVPAVPAAPAAPALPPAEPAPVAAAGPAPKRCDFTVALVNDQTFVFNNAVLTNAAKRRIDEEVLSKLAACTRTESVLVTGHTDRIGTQQYNQKLSQERAGAVAAYLKGRDVGLNIQTSGAGETQPVKTCDDKFGRKHLIDCLAPNRRVVVEVKGTAN